MEDDNERNRFLKYTPEHMHCHATIYGPVCPPNTGILAYQVVTQKKHNLSFHTRTWSEWDLE